MGELYDDYCRVCSYAQVIKKGGRPKMVQRGRNPSYLTHLELLRPLVVCFKTLTFLPSQNYICVECMRSVIDSGQKAYVPFAKKILIP